MPPSGRVGFEFNFSAPKPARKSGGPRLRMLFIANFAGQSLPPFVVKKVDADNLDEVLRSFSPQVTITSVAEDAFSLSFTSLEDFHPDQLLRRVPALVQLERTRDELRNPRTFADAASRLLSGKTPAAAPPPAAGSTLFATLLGGEPAKPSATAAPVSSSLDAVISRAVAPHILPAADPQQNALVAAVEHSLAEGLRSVLHAPAFASLEAAWRGLEHVLQALSPDPAVELWLAAAPPEVLLADAKNLGGQLDHSLLNKLICGEETPAWSMVFVDHVFGKDVDDVLGFGALGAIAARAGTSVVAGGSGSLAAGAPSETQELWQTLRQSPIAPHVALVSPRLLLRLPYGPRRNEVHALAFDELGTSAEPSPRRLLWGSGAWAVARALGRAFIEDPNDLPLASSAEITDRPTLVFVDKNGDKQLYPSCETWLNDQQAESLLAAGLIPLVANRSLAQATLYRLQSIAVPPQPLLLRKVAG